jgi:hypothetical protein
MNKTKLLEIAQALDLGSIDDEKARTLLLDLLSVRLLLPDADNYDYLRGFVDGYGGEEPHDVFPNGFNNINEVWDRMYELKGNEAFTIYNEELVKEQINNLQERNQMLEAKILDWYLKSKDEKFAEHFGIKKVREGRV